ncbi:MAG: AAA family ATPase, partial [Rhodobacteraceae bacterium]|nr:AAA family ATPase [Paracoccaceae bacterium]
MTSGENRPAAELSLDEILDRYEDQDGGGVGHRNPFKFLDSYGPDDLDIFFGREADTEEALRHFYRRKHLVLYGESGSGKTSLVQCGLRGKIAGEDAVFITLRSHRDPWRQLRHAVKTRLPGAGGGHDIPELLRRLADHESCTIVLVFDQFEELFIYHGMKVKQDFARELQKLIDIRLDIKILFIIRQEYLAHLTELEQEVPALFENRLWLRRMSDDDATRAVETACQVCGVGIEPGLAGNIVQRLTSEGSGVELPYLQVVMDRLYHKAVDADDEAPLISAAAYEAEGRIEDILARFLEEEVDALKSPEHGRQILKALVTSEGTKKVVTRDELARDALNYGDELDANEMGLVLRQLVESRILREDPQRETLELRHDTLAATVFAWMTGLEKELLEIRQSLHNRHKEYLARKEAPGALLDTGFLQYLGPYEGRLHLEPDIAVYIQRSHDAAQHQSRRRKRLMFGGFATAFSVLLAFSAWNLAERAKVALLAKGLLVGKLESHAEELSHTRPVVSALLALQILGMSDSGQADVRTRAQSLLRSVLAKLDGTGLGYLDQAVAKVSISPGGERIAVLDAAGAVSHWHRDTRERVQVSRIQLPSASRATNLLLSPDGEQLAIISRDHGVWLQDLAGDTGTVTLRKLGEHTTTIHDLAFSPDGQWLAT